MDFSLWDPPICEDESSDFGGNFVENWLQSDFYNGYGFHDVMEEEALNEKACREVLKRMLSKAETETEELEKEIAMLQSQLDRADEVWSKKHTSLMERTKSLDELIQRLKDEEQRIEHIPRFHFQRLREQAEKLSVSLKTLLERCSSNIVVQNGDTTSSTAECCRPAIEMPTQSNMDKANLSIQETDNQDSTTEAEKRMYTAEVHKQANAVLINTSIDTLRREAGSNCIKVGCNTSEEKGGGIAVKSSNIEIIVLSPSPEPMETTIAEADKFADMTSGCMQDAAKQMAKESTLKRKLKMQEDASGANLMNTRKQELLKNRREKAQLVDQVPNTEVVGKEPPKSHLLSKSGTLIQTEDFFPEYSLIPEPSLAIEMELKFSSMKNSQGNMISRIPNGHAGENCDNKENDKGAHLNFEGDKSNIVSADTNLDSTEIGNKCPVPTLIGKNVVLKNVQVNVRMNGDVTTSLIENNAELKNVQVNLQMNEDVTSRMIKEENKDVCKNALLKPVEFLPILQSLPMAQLRAMAKERNLKRYHKLKKSELIKLLE